MSNNRFLGAVPPSLALLTNLEVMYDDAFLHDLHVQGPLTLIFAAICPLTL